MVWGGVGPPPGPRPACGVRVVGVPGRGHVGHIRIRVWPRVHLPLGRAHLRQRVRSVRSWIHQCYDAFTGTSVASDGTNHPYFDVGQDRDDSNDWLGPDDNRLPVGSLETGVGMVTRPVLVGDRLVYGGSSGGKESQRVRLPPPQPQAPVLEGDHS